MPGIQDVPAANGPGPEKTAGTEESGLFVGMLADLLALSQGTQAAATDADQAGGRDGTAAIPSEKEVSRDITGQGLFGSLGLIVAAAVAASPVAVQQAASPSMDDGSVSDVPAAVSEEAAGKEIVAVSGTEKEQAGISQSSPVVMPAATPGSAAAETASAISPGTVPQPEADGYRNSIPSAPQMQYSGTDVPEKTQVLGTASDQTAMAQTYQPSMTSIQAKVAPRDTGGPEEKTASAQPADAVPEQQIVSGEPTATPLRAGNTETATPRRSGNTETVTTTGAEQTVPHEGAAALPASGSGTDAAGMKRSADGAAQIVKSEAPAIPEREAFGEVKTPAVETETIRTRHETAVVPDGRGAAVDASVRQDSTPRLHEVAEAPRIVRVQDQEFQVTRLNSGRLEVTVHPEGLGKLDIEVNLASGQIHARISASDTQVRDLLERNLPDIMNALAAEGHTVGGFSVGLRDGREQPQQGPSAQHRTDVPKAVVAAPPTVRPADSNLVSIFV